MPPTGLSSSGILLPKFSVAPSLTWILLCCPRCSCSPGQLPSPFKVLHLPPPAPAPLCCPHGNHIRPGTLYGALEDAGLRSLSSVSSWATKAHIRGGLTRHCPWSQESGGPCSWVALTPPSPADLWAGPARDAGRMWSGESGAEAGLRGCIGPPAPGRRKRHRVSVAGPGIPHSGTSSSSQGRCSCRSGTNTLTPSWMGARGPGSETS